MTTEYKKQSVIAFEVVVGVHRVAREAGGQMCFMPVVADVVWYVLGYVCSRVFQGAYYCLLVFFLFLFLHPKL